MEAKTSQPACTGFGSSSFAFSLSTCYGFSARIKDGAAHPVQAAALKFQPSLFAAGLLTGTRAGEVEMGRRGAYPSQG